MKIIKKIFKWLLILIVLLTIVSFFLPREAHVERSIVINSTPEAIFPHLNNFENWMKWSPWEKKDTAMKKTFEATVEGTGAKYSWSGNSNVGVGSMSILASIPNDSVQMELTFEGMGKSNPSFKLRKDSAGTKVTWALDTKGEGMPWYMYVPSKYFNLLGMDKMMGKDFEEGLNNLKTLVESMPLPSAPASNFNIEETTTTSQTLATYRMMTSEKTISADIGASYGKIGMFAKKNNLTQSGAVLAFYHSYSPDKIDIECAVPINKKVKGDKEVNVIETKGGNAVVAHYFGAYDKVSPAHDALHKWIGEHNKKINGSPWEVYVNDPMMEKDTSKWQTDIYYPID